MSGKNRSGEERSRRARGRGGRVEFWSADCGWHGAYVDSRTTGCAQVLVVVDRCHRSCGRSLVIIGALLPRDIHIPGKFSSYPQFSRCPMRGHPKCHRVSITRREFNERETTCLAEKRNSMVKLRIPSEGDPRRKRTAAGLTDATCRVIRRPPSRRDQRRPSPGSSWRMRNAGGY